MYNYPLLQHKASIVLFPLCRSAYNLISTPGKDYCSKTGVGALSNQ